MFFVLLLSESHYAETILVVELCMSYGVLFHLYLTEVQGVPVWDIHGKAEKKKEVGKGGAGVAAIHFEGQKLYLKLETTKPHLTVLLKTIGWQSEVTAFDVTYLITLLGVQNMFYLLHLYMLGV